MEMAYSRLSLHDIMCLLGFYSIGIDGRLFSGWWMPRVVPDVQVGRDLSVQPEICLIANAEREEKNSGQIRDIWMCERHVCCGG